MQAGVYGVTLPISIAGYDLSTSTAFLLKIKQPNVATPVTRNLTSANIVPPATAGNLQYTVVAADFPVPGLYTLEIWDTTPGRNVPMTMMQIYVNETE